MTLSILIASINDQEETLATLKSIRATAPPDVEIVLVDDCSGSPIAADWRRVTGKTFPVAVFLPCAGWRVPRKAVGKRVAQGRDIYPLKVEAA